LAFTFAHELIHAAFIPNVIESKTPACGYQGFRWFCFNNRPDIKGKVYPDFDRPVFAALHIAPNSPGNLVFIQRILDVSDCTECGGLMRGLSECDADSFSNTPIQLYREQRF
jgi:hypothetical protein